MSIPLDRLYHYIESIAQKVYGNIVIYRFYPHGSKKIEDLEDLKSYNWVDRRLNPELICYDQEPLNYDLYKDVPAEHARHDDLVNLVKPQYNNLRLKVTNIYDRCLLLHSEKNSINVEKYRTNGFIPVYYWSHGMIARDWFRYAKYYNIVPAFQKKLFLIYNRAWSNTREYRLKFLDLIIDQEVVNFCQTNFNPVEPDTKIHYSQHNFLNNQFRPNYTLENYFSPTVADSTASADIDLEKYQETEIEVVLETLFDDSRLHLTEKILRPIACGHPFIVVSATGSLNFLKSYGFKTFDSVFDESYDDIKDPLLRLQTIVALMKKISQWSDSDRIKKFKEIQKITDFNKKHFFSDTFFNSVVSELQSNLHHGLMELEATNTSATYIKYRKLSSEINLLKQELLAPRLKNTHDLVTVLKKARSYYNKYNNK